MGKLWRIGFEEEHAAVTESTTGSGLAEAAPLPCDALAIRRYVDSFALAEYGTVRTDDRCVGTHAGGGNPEQVPAGFKCHFYGWWFGGDDTPYDPLAPCFAYLFADHELSFLLSSGLELRVPARAIVHLWRADTIRRCCGSDFMAANADPSCRLHNQIESMLVCIPGLSFGLGASGLLPR